ncbi:hypothetical protein H8E77_05100 [bacterium]|nr:hypothetical protein [bacterium]
MAEKTPKNDKGLVQTAFQINKHQLLQLKAICAFQKKSMAKVLRELAEEYIDENYHAVLSYMEAGR